MLDDFDHTHDFLSNTESVGAPTIPVEEEVVDTPAPSPAAEPEEDDSNLYSINSFTV